MAGIFAQSGAVAFGAGLRTHVFRQLFADHGRFGFTETPLHVGQNAFEWPAPGVGIAAVIDVAELYDFLAAAVEDDFLDFLRQLVKRCVDRKTVVVSH